MSLVENGCTAPPFGIRPRSHSRAGRPGGECRKQSASEQPNTTLSVEARRGRILATRALITAYAVVAGWCAIAHPWPENLAYVVMVGLFAGIGAWYLQLIRAEKVRGRHDLAFVALNAVLLVSALVVPFDDDATSGLLRLRGTTLGFLMVLPVWAAFGLAPRRILLTAAICLAAWGVGVATIVAEATEFGFGVPSAPAEILRYLTPGYVDIDKLLADVIAFLIVAGMLSVLAARTRRIALEEAEIERKRSNLARYLPPNLVETLGAHDEPMGPARRLDAAILFVDIVGFTQRAERLEPESAMELLRRFHTIVAGAVFTHGGTLNKFLGDGTMATFGTPAPGPYDAADGLACARALMAGIAAWNEEHFPEDPIRIGIGLHFGPVVVGDIGDARQLDYSVVGDVVNVASRLQGLTRTLGTTTVVSKAVIARCGIPDWLNRHGLVHLPGRSAPVEVWTG